MIGNLNIRDNDWNLSYLYYSTYIDILREITDSFNLELLLLLIKFQLNTQITFRI